ncbi:hypothetical protein [uncultured Dokdonia sp.]|mgnify:CR=1 FL=1|uniref:hypothetical protein n=1 Tax=uncultured Dokdonia sp. TaxID=575653 RepID=UPI002609D975|nr:hypothetical protein [uncultured Dokdonia sp.]
MKTAKVLFTAMALLWLIVTVSCLIPISLLLMPFLYVSKKYYTEWILFFFASISAIGIYPIGFLYRIVKWKGFKKYLRQLSLSIDISGNSIAGDLLNDNFITKESVHKFGVVRETISDNLGENERDNTLTSFGRRVTILLSVFDFDHARKSIIED